VIKPHYEKYRQPVETESATGIPEDVVFGPIPYRAYFVACAALLKIDGSPEYDKAIRKYSTIRTNRFEGGQIMR
jgi:hypothetical protein